MAKYSKKSSRCKGKLLTTALIILCFCILSGTTLAYLVTETDVLSSIFNPAHISCEVTGTFSNGYADDVRVKNTGDADAYIRAAITINFVDNNGNVYATAPDETNYTITYGSGWKMGEDGYWYYLYPVANEKSTAPLVETFTQKGKSYAPRGYQLTIEVVASAIQASGTDAVVQSWNSGVEKLNGSTLVIKEASK